MQRIGATGLVPVVVIDDAAKAVATAKALLKGGVNVMEITMRTAAGMEAIGLVSEACPGMLVGAGTILSMEQCKNAIRNGAKFIVSPGFDPEIVDYCNTVDIPICPGCVTPTEITAAINQGIKVVKFFPANIYGGLRAMSALSGPFSDIQFIPTGGIDLSNLADYVNKIIFAIGGGWLCSRDSINKDKYEEITEACTKSVDILLDLKDELGNPVTLNNLIVKGGKVTTINLERATSQLIHRGFDVMKLDKGREFINKDVTIHVKLV